MTCVDVFSMNNVETLSSSQLLPSLDNRIFIENFSRVHCCRGSAGDVLRGRFCRGAEPRRSSSASQPVPSPEDVPSLGAGEIQKTFMIAAQRLLF